MKIDTRLTARLADVPGAAADLEQAGFAGAWTSEAGTDPFLPLAVAAVSSQAIELGTNITVAFARSPMTLAASANDLQAASQGRVCLGLGSQVRAHIERRYSMPWSHPAARMREYVAALRAIWSCWNEGAPLSFEGEYYTHTLSTPFFQPPPHPFGSPRVMLAAVGPAMTAVAAEACDGLLTHPFTTSRYLTEVTLPAVEGGLASSGRSREDFEIGASPLIVTGDDEESWQRSDRATRREIAFHGSTPAYRPVLDVHGWGSLQPELNKLSREGRWRTMTELIDDSMVETFAVVAPPDQLPGALLQRFEGVADRLMIRHGSRPPASWERQLAGITPPSRKDGGDP